MGKCRAAKLGRWRKICAAPERLAVRGEKHGQWPAALLSGKREGELVDGVEIGAFFAVDLDVDKVLVHLGRDGVVFEAFVRHDMTPVAGGIADREQDRFVLASGLTERGLVPGLPMHGIVLVLGEVEAGFVG